MKNKHIITITIVFVLLLSLGLSSFAMDFTIDGVNKGAYLYPLVPIQSVTWVASNATTTNELDSITVPLVGYLANGNTDSYTINGSNAHSSSYSAQVDIVRSSSGDNLYRIDQTIQPLGTLMVSSTQTQFFLNCGSWFATRDQYGAWVSDYRPQISAISTNSSGYMQAVIYNYTAIVYDQVGDSMNDNDIGLELDSTTVNGTYTQTYTSQDSTKTLFQNAFYEHIINDYLTNHNFQVGSTDDLTLYFNQTTIKIVSCEARATIRWNSINDSTKKIKIRNYFTENLGNSLTQNEHIWLFGSIPRDVTIVNPPSQELDFSAFGNFISDTVGGFMNTSIFGSVTFGMIVYTVLGIGLLMWILKMFGGG